MLKLFVGCCLVGCCLGLTTFGKSDKPVSPKVVQSAGPVVGIRSQVNDIQPDGSYVFSYETENGDKFEENGQLKTVEDTPVIGVGGSYSYTGDDGQVYSVTYTADENGFIPVGEHIPQVPEYIARALAYIAEHPYVEE